MRKLDIMNQDATALTTTLTHLSLQLRGHGAVWWRLVCAVVAQHSMAIHSIVEHMAHRAQASKAVQQMLSELC